MCLRRFVLPLVYGCVISSLGMLLLYKPLIIKETKSDRDWMFTDMERLNSLPKNPVKATNLRTKERLRVLREQCERLNLTGSLDYLDKEQLNAMDLMVDDEHQVILKAVTKTGCTSWRTILINSANSEKRVGTFQKDRYQEIGLATMVNYTLEEGLERARKYYSILTVRHPLKRIESFFTKNFLHRHHIAPGETDNTEEEYYTLFFSNFITKLLQPEVKHNYHLNAIYNQSHPCEVSYSYIAKTETAEDDMQYIVTHKLSGFGGALHKNPRYKLEDLNFTHPSQNMHPLPMFNSIANKDDIIRQVAEKYYIDMVLFGYSLKLVNGTYYAICTDGSLPC